MQQIKFCLILTIALISLSLKSAARIFPSEAIKLNYTQIMFEYNPVFGATEYRIHIFPQTKFGGNDTKREIIIRNYSLAIIVDNILEFGENYKWYYEAYINNNKLKTSDEFFFGINPCPFIDSNHYQFSVTQYDSITFTNNILFLDQLGIAVNRKGKPIWFLPNEKKSTCRNIAMSSNGTITLLQDNDCIEKDLLGNVIWLAPNDGKVSGDSAEYYHHDFSKLKNGTFFTSSYIFVKAINPFNPSAFIKIRYNTLIQYDVNKKILWSWNEKNFIDSRTMFAGILKDQTESAGTHLNSFFVDEKNNCILTSYRNNSRIAMIDKKTGMFKYQFTGKTDTLLPESAVAIDFSKQHHATILKDGNIMFYNNNVDFIHPNGKPIFPHVVIVSPPTKFKKAEIIWDYECSTRAFPKGINGKEGFAKELPNGNILISMGGANRSIEVTRNKNIVWECFFEKIDATTNTWQPVNNYRTNFTSSLYPQYYTVDMGIAADSLPINNHAITINNEGTEDDSYQINIFATDQKTILMSSVISVKKRSAKSVKIQLNKKTKKLQSIYVEVFPLNNKEYAYNSKFIAMN
jgi:hypothetical protein